MHQKKEVFLYSVFCKVHNNNSTQHTTQTALKYDSEHIKELYLRQQTRKANADSEAVVQAIITPGDGQRRSKHVVCRRRSESDTQLVLKVFEF
jgi:hypothetical protein